MEQTNSRQANSTIKGFLYQFNKSLFEILNTDDDTVVMLEGQIEDIDIITPLGVETTVQCKYHEDQNYKLSSVVNPILEMFSHFIEQKAIGRKIKYILFAHFKTNVQSVNQNDFDSFLKLTKNKETIVKYFPKIFKITDSSILDSSLEPLKGTNTKERIVKYFTDNKLNLIYRADLSEFFSCFEYQQAEKYDDLKQNVIDKLCENEELNIVENLYYPNALTKISELSTLSDSKKRKISRKELYSWLKNQKVLLLSKWTLEIKNKDREIILKAKKEYISKMFSGNSDIRAFVFSKCFLANNHNNIVQFMREYIGKYNSKKKLQKPPIFILETDSKMLNWIVRELFKYQISVNYGIVGDGFIEDSFINNTNCSADFLAKITLKDNINCALLQKCVINYLFYIGDTLDTIRDSGFGTEVLGISSMAELKYLVGLNIKILEESQ